MEGSGDGFRGALSDFDSGGAVLEGREFKSIKFSVGERFDVDWVVVDGRGSEAVERGALAVPEP